ncbi:MAG: hypothetical protein ACK44A_15980 [Roseateles sp.]
MLDPTRKAGRLPLARATKHHDGSQLSSAVQAKAGKKKTAKAKHKKHAKKGLKKSA